ncbi:MAG: hypothetical protein DI603_16625 [Roseateles depolymerans]|uniref:Polysaccharide biosynthesis protein n=1 Tax=Roseateles depolymerans TaxID=76731 RepID=A0A2W5DCF3_9BURK|nr:MAG: hypothetical protein DI603_16625 [Roseateles depolymerans]
MSSVRTALLQSLIERYLLLALALASNIALARLLTPEEIGIYSVSLAILGVAQVFRDFGIGSYLIQSRELDEEKTGTAFAISLLLGTLLFATLFLVAPIVSKYYGDKRITDTIRICAINFIALPFSTVPMAVLRRELQFKKTMHASIIGGATGALTSTGLAWAGVGVNSLALGAMLGNLALVGALAIAAPKRCFPKPKLTYWRAVLAFGGQTSLTGAITSISMDMNDLVVGKTLGFQPVAILSRAQGLMNMFNRDLMAAIRNVALPAFAETHRKGTDLGRPYAHAVALVTVFGWPFHALIAIYSLEVLHLLYGVQWLSAAPLVPLFSLAGAVTAVNALTPNLLTAIGRVDLTTRVEVLVQTIRMALIAGAAVIFRSIEACAIAFMLSSVIAAPVFGWVRERALGGGGQALRQGLAKSAVVTLACATPALIHVSLVGWGHQQPIAVWAWLSVCALGALAALAASHLVGHPLEQEPHILKLKSRLRGGLARRGPEQGHQ